MVIDPVCKMRIDERTAAAKSDYQGTTYYFCSKSCQVRFDQDPGRYLQSPASAGAPGPSKQR